MNNAIKFSITKKNVGERLDVFLSKNIKDFTRSYIKKLITARNVKLNGKILLSASTKVKEGDQILVKVIQKNTDNLIANKIDLKIIYEDKDLLIVNKSKGMVVHPGAGNLENTLANALKFKYKNNLSNRGGNLRPGIVHRIDKNTSGLLVIAKNNLSHSNLSKQFANHSIKRKYNCLVWGVLRPMQGTIKTLISRNKKNRKLMTVSDINGKLAITNYKTLRVFYSNEIPKISFIECELETGRTHQIRVHLKYKKTSILGDKEYGKNKLKFKKINQDFLESLEKLNGQVLHAKTLEFTHPSTNKHMKFSSNVPNEFKKLLHLLENLTS